MKTPLLPTQVLDIEKLSAKSDLPNFSLPGTGKTLTTIGAIAAMKLQNGVVVGPIISLPMWKRSLEYELGAKVQLISTGSQMMDPLADFYVMSYGMMAAHHRTLLGMDFDGLVLDESHYLKTPDSRRTVAAYGVRTDGAGGVYKSSRYCFTLTGSPIERHADDMWAQLRALQPDALQNANVLSLEKFRERFTYWTMKQYNPRMKPAPVVSGSKNEDELNHILYHEIGVIRRTIDELVNDMPPVTFRDLSLPITLDRELVRKLRHLNLDAASIIGLLQLNDALMAAVRRAVGLAKVSEVAEYVVDASRFGQCLVGYWHTDVGTGLVDLLRTAGVSTERIGGDTNVNERDNIAQRFNSGQTRVLVGQIAAAGVSLNLQANCNHVVLAELPISPSQLDQFYKRVWRMGQTKHVQVDMMVAEHELDTALQGIVQRKAVSADAVLLKPSPLTGKLI